MVMPRVTVVMLQNRLEDLLVMVMDMMVVMMMVMVMVTVTVTVLLQDRY